LLAPHAGKAWLDGIKMRDEGVNVTQDLIAHGLNNNERSNEGTTTTGVAFMAAYKETAIIRQLGGIRKS
jgi:hypothetical protein